MNYDLLRGLHILAVIAWMAGIMYLPRLFAYHADAIPGSEMDQTFQTMERKLYRIIMDPAMTLTWVFGLALTYVNATQVRGGWDFLGQPWMLTKLAGIVFLTGWHQFLGASMKRFAAGENKRPARFWKMTNELPFLAAIVMVIAVTTEFLSR
ncbi:MAG: CopD family protein [Phenylobacterium sp.]|uniref:CopD family protein n=1 Tax=Phenylobacterium sp. TaxID=1871053 RepID=UPI002735E24D|nr:CopD family protein [Phenylobacterium sp.]MDP3746019.1 CopD family protein [Phenylobacterium sp.]